MTDPATRPAADTTSLAIALGVAIVAVVGALASALSPTRGYELSWISATPPIAMLAVAIAIGATVALAYRGAFGLAALTSALAALVVGLQPYLRGYAAYGRADVMTYLGHIGTIVDTGRLASEDLYPLVHLLWAMVELVGGVGTSDLLPIYSIAQYGAWVALVWIGARRFLTAPARVAVALLVATVPIFTQYHFILYPNGYAMLFMALTILAWIERDRLPMRLLLIGVLVLVPYAHPLVAVLSLVLLITLHVANVVLTKIRPDLPRPPRDALLIPTIGAIVLLSWLMDFRQIQLLIRRSFGLLENRSESQAAEVTGQLFQTDPQIGALAIAAAVLIGATTILSALGFASFLRSRRALMRGHPLVLSGTLGLTYALLAMATLAFLVVPVLGHGIFFLRAVNLPYPMLVAAWAIAAWIPRDWAKRALPIAMGLALVVAAVGVYRSPLVFQPNDQVSAEELAMAEWLHAHAPADRLVSGVHSEAWRFIERASGSAHVAHHNSTFGPIVYLPRGLAPEHFGLPQPLSEIQGEDHLLTITVYDRTAYETVWARSERYTATDLATVDTVFGNARVYHAGSTRVLWS